MFFILTLLNRIKEDKNVREENYNIVREINEFLELYANDTNEKRIEEALKKRKELKEFVDAYLLNLNTKEIAALITQTDSPKKQTQTHTPCHTKKPPYHNKIERGL